MRSTLRNDVNDLPNSYSTYSRYLQAPWAPEMKYVRQNLQRRHEEPQQGNQISLTQSCLYLMWKSVRCWYLEFLKDWCERDLPRISALEGKISQLGFHFQDLLLHCSKRTPKCVSFVLYRMKMYAFQVYPLLLSHFVKWWTVPLVKSVLLG